MPLGRNRVEWMIINNVIVSLLLPTTIIIILVWATILISTLLLLKPFRYWARTSYSSVSWGILHFFCLYA
jgi:hypothetical protein